MKNTFIFIIVFLAGVKANPQSYLSTLEYNKKVEPALRLELAKKPEDVKTMILERLSLAGFKPKQKGFWFWKKKKSDGFFTFTGVPLPYMNSQKFDMYLKIYPKDGLLKDSSILYLLVSTGNEKFPPPESDPALWSNAKIFLNSFSVNDLVYKIDEDILKQEKVIVISQKNLSILQTDGKNLEAKMKQIQDELQNNQQNQTNQQRAINEQKKTLENLKNKRTMQ